MTTTTNSNFDLAGNLITPRVVDPDDAESSIPQVSANNAVSLIRTRVENANTAAAVLKEARDNNVGLNQDIYDEAYRRAQLEADYYNARWAEVLAHNVDTRTDNQKDPEHADYVASPITVASRNAALTVEMNKRFLAEQDLRTKVALR